MFARFADPDCDPASMTYVVGEPLPAFHMKLIVPPEFTVLVNPVGAPGATPGEPPTTSTTSFDVALAPDALVARTRT